VKRPLVNLLSLVSGDLGSRFLGFLVTVYLARVLGPSSFGVMSMGLAVLGYLQLAGSAGIPILEIRNTAAAVEIDYARVSAVLSLRVILAAMLWILTAVVALVCVIDDVTRDVIILFALSVFPLALMLDWFFQGKEVFLATSLSRLVQYIVYGILVLLLVHGADDIRQTGIAFGAGILAAAVVLWMNYRNRWGPIRLRWMPGVWKDILTKGMPVGAAMFLAQSVTNLPPLAIGYFSSVADVGMFSSAMKLIFLMLLVDRLFNALFLPVVTRYFSSQPGEVHTLVEIVLRVVLAVVIPLAVAGIIVGREAITVILGERYEQATPLFNVLIGYFVLTVLNSTFVCILIGSGRENGYTKMVTWGSVVFCVATVACTALFGALGAACAVVVGEFVTLLLMMKEAAKVVRVSVAPILVRPLIAGVCMAGTALLLHEKSPLMVAAMALLVFAVVEALLRGITRKEIQFIRERFV
jgi:O-antigen/teichoic acid export membrane protein